MSALLFVLAGALIGAVIGLLAGWHAAESTRRPLADRERPRAHDEPDYPEVAGTITRLPCRPRLVAGRDLPPDAA